MFDMGRSFLASVDRCPDALAISDYGVRLTYSEWLDDILRVVAGFEKNKINFGHHIITMLTNRYEAATIHIACQLSGVIITPLNWRAPSEELNYVVKDSEAVAIIFESNTEKTIASSSETKYLRKFAVDTDHEIGIPWEQFKNCHPAPKSSKAYPDNTSVMLYTSGTTGRSKGVPRSHFAERASAIAHVAQNLYHQNEVTLGVMPLYHTMGVRSLLASIINNGHFVCQQRFDPEEALHLIEQERITNLYLVPTLYHDLISSPSFAHTDISSVQKLGFAGQAMTDGLLKRLEEKFKPELFVNHYGSSEIYTFTVERNAVRKPGSAGKAGINQNIRIVKLGSKDPERLTTTDEEGQIIASLDGDEAFDGYWKRDDANEKSIYKGWYFTGDIGYRDIDGDLFVTGRVDDMIISGGENILPAEIESVLSLHPAVAEVAVVGLPNERWGQQVTAFISKGHKLTLEELDAWCLASTLASFKRPREYIFVQEVPKSPVGKILRRLLVSGNYEKLEEN